MSINTFLCSKSVEIVFYLFLNIFILKVPIKDVYIFSISETGDEVRIGEGEQLVMQEGQRIEYGCAASVNGSHLAPEVEITVDGKDKTKDFVAKNTAVSYPSDDDLPSFYTEQKLKFVEESPDSSSNQKLFKCTALTRSFQPKTASAVMNIKRKLKTLQQCCLGQTFVSK